MDDATSPLTSTASAGPERRTAPRAMLLAAFAIVAGTVAAGASHAVPAQLFARTAVAVTVGAPTEISVKLSRSSAIPAGTVVFIVTNRGQVKHVFKICSTAVTSAALANACTGKAVTLATTGQSSVLTVTLKTGKYEFLSSVTGQSGKKGLIGIGVKVPAATRTIPKASTGTTTPPANTGSGGKTTTTSAPPTSSGGGKPTSTPPTFPTGSAASGATVFATAGCVSCHTLAAANATGGGGPNLDDLKPSISDVENQVFNGSTEMPAFGGQLTNQQIADVATYVFQSTH